MFTLDCMKLMTNINNIQNDYDLSMFMLCFVVLKIAYHVRFMFRGSKLLTYNILRKEWRKKYGSIRNFPIFSNKSKF